MLFFVSPIRIKFQAEVWLHTRLIFHLCFWSVNEARCGFYREPLKSYWHTLLSSTAPLRLFSHCFPTSLRDRKSLLLYAVCLPAQCPPFRFWHCRLSQPLSQGSKDWHPFHFPAWAAQIKGHFLNLCVDTPTVKRDGLVGPGWAAVLTSHAKKRERETGMEKSGPWWACNR